MLLKHVWHHPPSFHLTIPKTWCPPHGSPSYPGYPSARLNDSHLWNSLLSHLLQEAGLDSLQDHTPLSESPFFPLALDRSSHIDHNDFISALRSKSLFLWQLIKDKTPSPPRFTGSHFCPESLVRTSRHRVLLDDKKKKRQWRKLTLDV